MIHKKQNKFVLLENGKKENWIEVPESLRKMKFNSYVWYRGYSGGAAEMIDLSKEVKTNQFMDKLKQILAAGLQRKISDTTAIQGFKQPT